MMKAQQVKQMCKQAYEELIEAVEAGKSETLLNYLKVMGRFHRYSLGNQMLIQIQRKNAKHLAGFCTWQKLGRSVKKGAKGIAIMAPVVCKKKRSDLGEDEKLLELEHIHTFKTVYVFDIKDTDGTSLPEFAQVKGDPGVSLEQLKAYISAKGILLKSQHLYGSTQGYSAGGLIVLKSGLSQAEEFSTLVHELVHEILHRDQDIKKIDRKIMELEAEAAAYVVCQGIGLDTGTSNSDYIQLYDGDKKSLLGSLSRIQMTASEILESITSDKRQAQAA